DGAELKCHAFLYTEPLGYAQVHVVDGGQLEGIAASVGESTPSGSNVLRVGVCSQIANEETVRRRTSTANSRGQRALAQRRNAAAHACRAFGVKDRAVARRVAVQVAVERALHVAPLAGLVAVDGRNLEVAQQILLEPAPALEPGHIVNPSQGETAAVVQSGVRSIRRQVLEVLGAAWRDHGAEKVSCAVVDVLAVGVG